jgi:hypothetical protein
LQLPPRAALLTAAIYSANGGLLLELFDELSSQTPLADYSLEQTLPDDELILNLPTGSAKFIRFSKGSNESGIFHLAIATKDYH